MKNVCICIPARYNSSRLPGKLLYKIGGKSVLQRVYEQVLKCAQVSDIYILTDHEYIYSHMTSLFPDINIILTDTKCKNGSERISKYLHLIPEKYDIIVNVQGDEPYVDPRNIDYVIAQHIKQNTTNIFYTTLHQKIDDQEYIKSSSCLKVVFTKDNHVMYYSRSVIPGNKTGDILPDITYYGFTGIYVFNREYLNLYKELEDTPLQVTEDIEQMKILEHGYKIKTFEAPHYNEISLNDIKDYDFLLNKYEQH